MMNVLGIDGCKFGWIVATLSQKQIEFYLVEHLDKLENFFLNEAIVGIDMPVDLITSNSRLADIQAKQLLKSRALALCAYWLSVTFRAQYKISRWLARYLRLKTQMDYREYIAQQNQLNLPQR